LGVTWTTHKVALQGTYGINVSFDLVKQVGGFIETYGVIEQGKMSTNIDVGIGYLINNDLQLDLYGGWQGKQDIRDYFISLGVSWRIHKRNI